MVLFYLSIQWDTCMRAIPMSSAISVKFSSLSALGSEGAFSRGQSTVSSAWGFVVSGAGAANSDSCLFEVTHHPVRDGIDCQYEKRKMQANNFFKMYPSISNKSFVFTMSLVVLMLNHCYSSSLSIKNLCGPQLGSQHLSTLQELAPRWS